MNEDRGNSQRNEQQLSHQQYLQRQEEHPQQLTVAVREAQEILNQKNYQMIVASTRVQNGNGTQIQEEKNNNVIRAVPLRQINSWGEAVALEEDNDDCGQVEGWDSAEQPLDGPFEDNLDDRDWWDRLLEIYEEGNKSGGMGDNTAITKGKTEIGRLEENTTSQNGKSKKPRVDSHRTQKGEGSRKVTARKDEITTRGEIPDTRQQPET